MQHPKPFVGLPAVLRKSEADESVVDLGYTMPHVASSGAVTAVHAEL